MNGFYYTTHGKNTNLGFEGADLVNFGENTGGHPDLLTIAPGFRYKFNDWASVGAAVEFPITQHEIFQDTRFTLDFIFRY